MNTTYPLTIYFDASCALCNSEMQNIKLHDTDDLLLLVDCSSQCLTIVRFIKKA